MHSRLTELCACYQCVDESLRFEARFDSQQRRRRLLIPRIQPRCDTRQTDLNRWEAAGNFGSWHLKSTVKTTGRVVVRTAGQFSPLGICYCWSRQERLHRVFRWNHNQMVQIVTSVRKSSTHKREVTRRHIFSQNPNNTGCASQIWKYRASSGWFIALRGLRVSLNNMFYQYNKGPGAITTVFEIFTIKKRYFYVN